MKHVVVCCQTQGIHWDTLTNLKYQESKMAAIIFKKISHHSLVMCTASNQQFYNYMKVLNRIQGCAKVQVQYLSHKHEKSKMAALKK